MAQTFFHRNLSKQEPYALETREEAEHDRDLRNEVLKLQGDEPVFTVVHKVIIGGKSPYEVRNLYASVRTDSLDRLCTLGWFEHD
jgi:hypothetical protein